MGLSMCLMVEWSRQAIDVKTLSELLGHKSPAVTLKKYAHTFLIHKKEMMNRLGKMLT